MSEIETFEGDFDECVSEAEDARKKLRNRLTEKVKTVRRLTDKFDIEIEEDLTEIYTDTVGQSSVDRLLEISDVCSTASKVARSQVREELPKEQAQLLEDLLALSTSASKDLTLSVIQSEIGNEYGDNLVETLLGLQNHELLEIEVSVS